VSSAEVVQRVVLALTAAAAIVWFAVSIADRDRLADAQRIFFSPGTRAAAQSAGARAAGSPSRRALEARLRGALAETRRAQALRPGDRIPLTARMFYYAYAGKRRRSLAAAEELTRAEPRNRAGWLAIAALDPRQAARALARERALVRVPR